MAVYFGGIFADVQNLLWWLGAPLVAACAAAVNLAVARVRPVHPRMLRQAYACFVFALGALFLVFVPAYLDAASTHSSDSVEIESLSPTVSSRTGGLTAVPTAAPTPAPTFRGLNVGGAGTACVNLVRVPSMFIASAFDAETPEQMAHDNFFPNNDTYIEGEDIIVKRCSPPALVETWQANAQNFADVIVNDVVDAINTNSAFPRYCQRISAEPCTWYGSFARSFRVQLERRSPCAVTTARRWQPAELGDGTSGLGVQILGRVLFACVDGDARLVYCENAAILVGFDDATLARVTSGSLIRGRSSTSECLAEIEKDQLQLGSIDPNAIIDPVASG
ncbi:MAG: hypothetical protein EPO22_05595 [Dehalococcoidia bacterium]|nr:MAG: hypothetical protein EPO22_05595 [Dehalococcoidia bacterium]